MEYAMKVFIHLRLVISDHGYFIKLIFMRLQFYLLEIILPISNTYTLSIQAAENQQFKILIIQKN
jgi:hypothetical protein